MSKFRVIGADKETGIDVTEVITADNSREAGVLAQSRGILVSSIERMEEEAVSAQPAINIVNQNTNSVRGGGRGNKHEGGFLFALLSFLWPGLGQICKGQVGAGILWMIAVWVGYALLVIPGFILHIMCIINANNPVKR